MNWPIRSPVLPKNPVVPKSPPATAAGEPAEDGLAP